MTNDNKKNERMEKFFQIRFEPIKNYNSAKKFSPKAKLKANKRIFKTKNSQNEAVQCQYFFSFIHSVFA